MGKDVLVYSNLLAMMNVTRLKLRVKRTYRCQGDARRSLRNFLWGCLASCLSEEGCDAGLDLDLRRYIAGVLCRGRRGRSMPGREFGLFPRIGHDFPPFVVCIKRTMSREKGANDWELLDKWAEVDQ